MEEFWTSDESDVPVKPSPDHQDEDGDIQEEFIVLLKDVGRLEAAGNVVEGGLPFRIDREKIVELDFPVTELDRPAEDSVRVKWSVIDQYDVSNFHKDHPELLMDFGFELDEFQKRAVHRIIRNQHTFVAAHTSAGKTVVAEYAVAHAANQGYRAIYTSPIKALTNQKFRDFVKRFPSVGIITGDVTFNPDAQLLLLTTEILAGMLFRGDEIINETAVVVFDEVHYVNDEERGLMWEETILLLPRAVKLVMLSATASNAFDFASWVGQAKQREVFVTGTYHRPIPLVHHLAFDATRVEQLMDGGRFNTIAYNKMVNRLKDKRTQADRAREASGGAKGKAKAKPKRVAPVKVKRLDYRTMMKSYATKLQKFVDTELTPKELLPAIIFCFSRQKCFDFAYAMPNLQLLNGSEKSKMTVFLNDMRKKMDEEGRGLAQITAVFELLSRGIAVHHGGLLPVVKEVVEISFQRGLVRVLIATETFAMGVNMPARSVVFTGIMKHDGVRNRYLRASEYTQMAGRAGRRGLDEKGMVYILQLDDDDVPNSHVFQSILTGASNPLLSQYHLTYRSLLNLALKRHSMRMGATELVSNTFMEATRMKSRLRSWKRRRRANEALGALPTYRCVLSPDHDAVSYLSQWQYLKDHKETIAQKYSSNKFKAGSLVLLDDQRFSCGCAPAVILNDNSAPKARARSGSFDMLVKYELSNTVEVGKTKTNEEGGTPIIILPDDWVLVHNVPLTSISFLLDDSAGVTKFSLSDDLVDFLVDTLPEEAAERRKAIERVTATNELSNGASWALLDHQIRIALGKISVLAEGLDVWRRLDRIERKSVDLRDLVAVNDLDVEDCVDNIKNNICHRCEFRSSHLEIEFSRAFHEATLRELDHLDSDNSLMLYEDLEAKTAILKERGFLKQSGVTNLKGFIGALLVKGDELSLVDTLFSGTLESLEPEDIAGVMAAFVPPTGTIAEHDLDMSDELTAALDQIAIIQNEVEMLSQQKKSAEPRGGWRQCFNTSYSAIAAAHCRGMPFQELTARSGVHEGLLVKLLLRTDERLRQAQDVLKMMSNAKLLLSFQKAAEQTRRGISFMPSLYFRGVEDATTT